jgi:predicted acyltransferase
VTSAPPSGQPSGQSARLVSLDAFRGFTIASMVLVNNPGDWAAIHAPLEHAPWNGWTFTDWVFPFFLFIAGVSMTLSLGRRAEAGADKRKLLGRLAMRAGIIFLIGLALNLIPAFQWSTLRIPGVLQRIALTTLLAAPIVVFFNWQKQVLWIIGLLSLYTCLMLFVPVPDATGRVGAGILEPGRDFGAFVDRLILGGHLWAKSRTWDPEGLVSTLPALSSQLFGVLTGRWIGGLNSKTQKAAGMAIAGLLFLGAAAVLDAKLMPINKSLWTPSYCVAMTGWALLVFSAFFWLIDANTSAAWRKRAERASLPFTIFGMNALFIFAVSSLVAKMLASIMVGHDDGTVSLKALLYGPIRALPIAPVNASLLYALTFEALMFLLAWGMWRRKWFVKV